MPTNLSHVQVTSPQLRYWHRRILLLSSTELKRISKSKSEFRGDAKRCYQDTSPKLQVSDVDSLDGRTASGIAQKCSVCPDRTAT